MYQMMFYGGLAGTFIFLILSVVLFIKNDVRKRIGDLTGANARKAIKEINEKAQRQYLEKESGEETGKIVIHEEKTDNEVEKTIKKASKKTKKPVIRKPAFRDEDTKVPESDDELTEVLPTLNNQEAATDVLYDEQTSVLAGDEAMELLTDEEGTELLNRDEATELLIEEVTETLASEEETELLYDEVNISSGGFNSILNGATNPDIVSGDDGEKTDLLTAAILAGYTDGDRSVQEEPLATEMIPIPDVFEVEEDVTVVHTEDMI